jgi:uncharacterized membrane protein YbhN (UPF0104 family)
VRHAVTEETRRWLGLGVRAVAVAAVAAGLYVFVRDLDGRALWAALQGAAFAPVVAGAAICFGNILWKSVGWHLLLGPEHPVSVLRLYRYTLAALAGSLLVPARAGEALRVYLLKRYDGVPITTSAAVALAEKLLDGLSLVVVVAQLPWLKPGLPAWVTRSILLLSVGAAVGMATLVVVRKTAAPQGLVGRLAERMMVLGRPRTAGPAFAAYLAGQIGDVVAVWLVLGAVGIHVGVGGALLVHLGVNVAILVPAMPGNVGSLELGALAALEILGVPRPAGMAFALIYHAMQNVPLLVIGLLDARLSLGRRDDG